MSDIYRVGNSTNSNCWGGTSIPVTSYWITTFISLSSGFGFTETSNKFTLGSKFLIELRIWSRITSADVSSIFSNSDSVILDPKFGLKNFSPGCVKTIFLIDRAIALEFLTTVWLLRIQKTPILRFQQYTIRSKTVMIVTALVMMRTISGKQRKKRHNLTIYQIFRYK